MAKLENVIALGENPPKRAMPAFLANLLNANQNIICTAKGDDVHKTCVADLLQKRLRIPIFQRRYCWGSDQWQTLLDDALIVVNGTKEKHALGRITCVKSDAGDGRLLVIDGQQRNTTCTLLLAAIRDIALLEHAGDPECKELALKLEGLLFSEVDSLEAWLSEAHSVNSSNIVIADGQTLDFAALIPTYCDRASYFSAVLPPRAAASATNGEWQRPREAKAYFLNKLAGSTTERLISLAEVVLYKLEWLLFPICISGEHQDGTEDVQIIYERLAVRDSTWCKPSRATEFASMGAADFIRNLMLGSFQRESDAIHMYKTHWLPIEQAAAAASTRSRDSNIVQFLEDMLFAFLEAQPERPCPDVRQKSTHPVVVGGELYPRFRKWLTAALASDCTAVAGESESSMLERKTVLLLRRLEDFAIKHLENKTEAPKKPVSKLGPTSGYCGKASGWRCKRCSFQNKGSFIQCTACSFPRPE